MDTVKPVLRFCLALLKETLALDLPNDSFLDLLNPENADFKPSIARGPRRSQVEAAIAAAEIWLQLHGSAALDPGKMLKEIISNRSNDARNNNNKTQSDTVTTPQNGAVNGNGNGNGNGGGGTSTSPKPPSYQSVVDPSSASEDPSAAVETAPQGPASEDSELGPSSAVIDPTHDYQLATPESSPSPSTPRPEAGAMPPQLARLREREEVESVASRHSDFSAANTGAPFKWTDPEVFSLSALERLITQLIPQLGGLDHSMTLKRLDFRAFDAVPCVHMLHAAISLCPNLDTVLLAFTTTSPDLATLQHILCGTGASKVTGLAIHSVGDALEPAPTSEWTAGEVDQTVGLLPLAQTFSRLEALGIDVRVDSEVMEFMANTSGPALRRLELVNGTGNGNLEMLAAAAVAAYGADMDENEFPRSSPSAHSNRETVQSRQIITLITRSPLLEAVNLVGCTALGSAGVATSSDLSPVAILDAIASRLPRLRALRVPGNATAQALTAVLSGCPLLEDLDLGPLPPHGPVAAIRALIDHGQSLRNLAFRFVPPTPLPGSSNNSTGGGGSAAEAAMAAQLRHALESIFTELLDRRGRFLRGIDGLGWPATDRVVRAVARHCPNLESLVLYPCSAVRSEAAVRDLVARCRRLVHLGLRGLPALPAGPGIGAGPSPIAVAVAAAEKEVRGRSLGSGPAAMATRR
ncbi:hypothetical protein DFJ73DRAFT_803573, partial [Zopfochytrium polystomum]